LAGLAVAVDGPDASDGAGILPAAPILPGSLEKRLKIMEQADRLKPPAAGGILFLGSSTIDRWKTLAGDFPGLPVVQRGIGGCTLEQVAGFARRLAAPFKPATVVLYAGENDLAGKSTPPKVLDAFKRTISELRAVAPQARIIFLSIKPSPKRATKHDAFTEANQLIAAACPAQRVDFVDINPALHDAAGEIDKTLFVRDLIHLNPQGYAKLAVVLRPLLAKP